MRLLARLGGVLVLCSVLAGCGLRFPIPLPTNIVPAPSTARPSASPSEEPDPLDATDALDVSAQEVNAFTSPSGEITCMISVDGARCDLPVGYRGALPSTEDECPGSTLPPSALVVSDDSGWICADDVVTVPEPHRPSTKWWQGTGFPTLTHAGLTRVTLPVGKKLIAGDFLCLSRPADITCGNLAIGAGFTLSREGVELF
ncbi:MAG: hypothetical protein LWW77_08950 [Propionibacteriales bacterium]|jgi:predicted small lipoprotein YifL|nr:hypothetical protein [Propionibacteriales bacterium]